MTRIINVQEITDEVKRTKLLLKAVRKFGYRTSMDDFIGKIEHAMPPDFIEKYVEKFKNRRMTTIGETGVEPLSMICYNVLKLSRERCGFYISRLRMGISSQWGKDPELRIIIEDEDEFKILWLQNFVRLLKEGDWDIRNFEDRGPTEPGDIDRHFGHIPMTCDRCGNSDLNKMLAWYRYLEPGGTVVGGTTTLPKFLYELKYPTREKIGGAGYATLITDQNLSAIKIQKITCEACINKDRPEGEEPKDYQIQMEIEPRRLGV